MSKQANAFLTKLQTCVMTAFGPKKCTHTCTHIYTHLPPPQCLNLNGLYREEGKKKMS